MAHVKKGFSPAAKRNITGYAFISPALIGFVVFCLFPMGFSFYTSLTDWNLKTAPTFVGFQNYMDIFTDKVALKSIRVTFYYTLVSVPLFNLYALFMAVLLNAKIKGMSAIRTIFYIPSIVPVVAASAIWMFIFNPYNGLLNQVVGFFGISPQMWIYSPSQVIPCLAVMSAWTSGGTAIIYLAALQGVPRHLYEAVDIDGGKPFHKLVHVTLPMISPVIFYNIVMSTINSMQVFTQAYIMTNGGPTNNSLSLVLLLYKRAFEQSTMGIASAMAWFLFVVLGVITVINFVTSKKWVYYGG